MSHNWTEAELELVQRRLKESATHSSIAREIGDGVTKNAVIGKAKRMKFEQGGRPARPVSNSVVVARRAKGDKNANGGLGRMIGRARAAGAASISEVLTKGMQQGDRVVVSKPVIRDSDVVPIPLMALTNQTCRWPLGDPLEPDFGFCGQPIVDGKSILDREPYCARHKRRAGSA
ncbi:MAG: GcrA family cell cycle regulator [Devosia sp.]|nr:GcrA family cell cycle regulator [Devosia sp.]